MKEKAIQDLGMAKKRDHKIMITTQAIEKIPLIKFKEIPETEYKMIQDFAKEVLRISWKKTTQMKLL